MPLLSPSSVSSIELYKDENQSSFRMGWCRVCKSYHDNSKPHLYGFVTCACDLPVKDMAERLRAFEAADDVEADGGAAVRQKEAAERGGS